MKLGMLCHSVNLHMLASLFPLCFYFSVEKSKAKSVFYARRDCMYNCILSFAINIMLSPISIHLLFNALCKRVLAYITYVVKLRMQENWIPEYFGFNFQLMDHYMKFLSVLIKSKDYHSLSIMRSLFWSEAGRD